MLPANYVTGNQSVATSLLQAYIPTPIGCTAVELPGQQYYDYQSQNAAEVGEINV